MSYNNIEREVQPSSQRDYSQDKRRVVKNTGMLYLRMLFTMAISFFTSRVVLESLGVEDYGIYNIVGGMVAMFTMVSGSLSSAISRFITFELGRGDQQRLNRVFSTSVVIQLVLSVILVLLIESIGVWFLENKLVIPAERMVAARWVLQFSLVTLLFNMLSIPYNATIIAHERMAAFAYIGMLDGVWRLIVAYLITISSEGDRLILYGGLLMCSAIVIRVIYGVYCTRHFEECREVRLSFDREIFRKMFGFSAWNMIGVSSHMLKTQGGSILLNMFGGGPAINAAKGVADQVNTAVTQFSSNFMTAVNPQITKSYASGEREYMMLLIFQGARISAYMLLALSLPILLNTDFLLSLWLKIVPDHAVMFVQLVLIDSVIQSLSNPLITTQLATGNIRNYQIIVGGLQLMNFPLSYVALRAGAPPEVVLIVVILLDICCLTARLFMLRGMVGLPSLGFLRHVVFNVLVVTIVAALPPYLLGRQLDISLLSFVAVSAVGLLSTAFAIYVVGCTRAEREFVNRHIAQLWGRIRGRNI